jgi:hypothetical protein
LILTSTWVWSCIKCCYLTMVWLFAWSFSPAMYVQEAVRNNGQCVGALPGEEIQWENTSPWLNGNDIEWLWHRFGCQSWIEFGRSLSLSVLGLCSAQDGCTWECWCDHWGILAWFSIGFAKRGTLTCVGACVLVLELCQERDTWMN